MNKRGMTAKGAIDALNTKGVVIQGNALEVARFLDGLSCAKKVLEIRIPEKVQKSTGSSGSFECPRCGIELKAGKMIDFCFYCGQSLDWSDSDGTSTFVTRS